MGNSCYSFSKLTLEHQSFCCFVFILLKDKLSLAPSQTSAFLWILANKSYSIFVRYSEQSNLFPLSIQREKKYNRKHKKIINLGFFPPEISTRSFKKLQLDLWCLCCFKVEVAQLPLQYRKGNSERSWFGVICNSILTFHLHFDNIMLIQMNILNHS